MATYYCIHGEVYNGNGTAKTPATTAGGVGAFNDAIAVITGAEPVLAAAAKPYTVIFKTNHNGSDISIIPSATLTFAGGTASNATVQYIFDDGTEWAGEGGTFILDYPTTVYDVEISAYAHVEAYEYRLQIQHNTTDTQSLTMLDSSAYFSGIHLIQQSTTESYGTSHIYSSYGINYSVGKFKITINKFPNNNSRQVVLITLGNSTINIDELQVIFGANIAKSSGGGFAAFEANNKSLLLDVGTLIFENVPDNFALTENIYNYSAIKINNFVYDNVDWDVATEQHYYDLSISNMKLNGVGNFDFFRQKRNAITRFQSGKFYPVTDSVLFDKSTNWSVKAELPTLVDGSSNLDLWKMVNYFDQTSGSKTLKVECLVYDQISNPSENSIWAVFTYTDTNGVIRTESTKKDGLLPTSNAVWSTLQYGALGFVSYKMELQTQFQVASDTLISATVYTNLIPPDTTTNLFIDPQIGVS